ARSGAQGGSMSASRMQKGASITYTHSGQRYLFGTTFDPPGYAIWDRERLGNPVERFPYSEHGKTEGLARYRAIEPKYEELPPGG
ncbi:MAG TPA: hypothetical protein VJ913_00430, partial [Actinomycetota bacterium]|nr:hypothetical protein [Actinomycetota bacterium]